MAKLSQADHDQMRIMRRAGAGLKVIAERFGCSIPHVSSIISGRVGKAPPAPVKPAIRPHAMPWATPARLMAGR